MPRKMVHRLGLVFCLLTLGAGIATSSPNLTDLATQSAQLSKNQVSQFETSLLTAPANPDLRAQLLGYYFLRQSESVVERRRHVLWMIQNQPASPFAGTAFCRIDLELDPSGYQQAKVLWQRQLDAAPNNTAVLKNFAAFLGPVDDELAEDLIRRGSELEPKNADWPERLALLDESRAARSPENRRKFAEQAFAQRQKACDMQTNALRRFAVFTNLPRDAFLAGDTIGAKRLAHQLLAMADNFPDDWNYGNAVHVANIVLGRIAYHSADFESAEKYLLAAGQTPGSPQLAAFGPDMALARELLQHGEARHVVHDYLKSCEKFWTSGSARLRDWVSTVDAGGTPDFGALAVQ